MDLGQFLFPDVENEIGKKMQMVWGEDAIPNHKMQIWCERYLFDCADRCYFPGSIRHVYALGLRAEEINQRYFVNHPIDEHSFFSAPQSKDLVFAGGIPTFDKRRIPEFFADAQLVTTIEKVFSSSFPYQIDVYNNPLIALEEHYEKLYAPHFDLMAKFPLYKFQIGMEGKKIREKLSHYKFGLMIYDFQGNQFGEQHFTNLVPTKMYLYLEAGIPIIISEEWVEAAKIIIENNSGLKISQEELPKLEAIIKNADYKVMRTNVIALRDELYKDGLKQLSK
jgi:hypothetical protein